MKKNILNYVSTSMKVSSAALLCISLFSFGSNVYATESKALVILNDTVIDLAHVCDDFRNTKQNTPFNCIITNILKLNEKFAHNSNGIESFKSDSTNFDSTVNNIIRALKNNLKIMESDFIKAGKADSFMKFSQEINKSVAVMRKNLASFIKDLERLTQICPSHLCGQLSEIVRNTRAIEDANKRMSFGETISRVTQLNKTRK